MRLMLKVVPLRLKVAEAKVGDHLHILNILELDPQGPSNCRHKSNWPANEDDTILQAAYYVLYMLRKHTSGS